jgi:hypothetical protein
MRTLEGDLFALIYAGAEYRPKVEHNRYHHEYHLYGRNRYCYIAGTKTIHIPVVVDDLSLMIACHELGHANDPFLRPRYSHKLYNEASAWEYVFSLLDTYLEHYEISPSTVHRCVMSLVRHIFAQWAFYPYDTKTEILLRWHRILPYISISIGFNPDDFKHPFYRDFMHCLNAILLDDEEVFKFVTSDDYATLYYSISSGHDMRPITLPYYKSVYPIGLCTPYSGFYGNKNSNWEGGVIMDLISRVLSRSNIFTRVLLGIWLPCLLCFVITN